MRLALYEPDIPQNAGALLRLGACLGVAVDLIEPAGFVLSDRRLKRAGMDYLAAATLVRHPSWAAFRGQCTGRLVLLTTKAPLAYHRFAFRADDTLLLGRESAGVPDAVHPAVDARLRIPMRQGLRSLNVALAAALVLGEALRQTEQFPEETPP
jgi:tRNA (cytidine/uridine-2'-O-)-methyltransferase